MGNTGRASSFYDGDADGAIARDLVRILSDAQQVRQPQEINSLLKSKDQKVRLFASANSLRGLFASICTCTAADECRPGIS